MTKPAYEQLLRAQFLLEDALSALASAAELQGTSRIGCSGIENTLEQLSMELLALDEPAQVPGT